jgi:hypothetical protein
MSTSPSACAAGETGGIGIGGAVVSAVGIGGGLGRDVGDVVGCDDTAGRVVVRDEGVALCETAELVQPAAPTSASAISARI